MLKSPDQISQIVSTAPPLPDTAMAILDLIESEEFDAPMLACAIGHDPLLAVEVFRSANTPWFGPRTDSLELAAMRLGTTYLTQVVRGYALRVLVDHVDSAHRELARETHRHSVMVALMCLQFNSTWRLNIQAEVYSAGLFHDIGKILLLPIYFEHGADSLVLSENLEQEQTLLGIDHATIGGKYLYGNGLPQEIAEVAAAHHNDEALQESPLLALVRAMDDLAGYFRGHRTIDGFNFEACAGFQHLASQTEKFAIEELAGSDVIREAVEVSDELSHT